MSLIHEALKKAELEKNPGEANRPSTLNPIIPGKKTPNKNQLILIGVLILSFGFLAYTRLLKKPAAVSMPQPIAGLPTPKTMQSPLEIKEKALQLFAENKFEESLLLWEQLTLLFPTDAEVYNNYGLAQKKLGKKAGAYEAYKQALALNKDYPECLNNLGVLFLSDAETAKAKGQFEKALTLKKEYADPHFNLALILEQERNSKEASRHYREYLSLSPNLEEGLKKKIQDKLDLLEKK